MIFFGLVLTLMGRLCRLDQALLIGAHRAWWSTPLEST